MRYFLYGSTLPEQLKISFIEKANNYGKLGPSDALELSKFSKARVRDFALQPSEVHEEFYRLALDCGIYQSHAKRIGDAIKEMRVSY